MKEKINLKFKRRIEGTSETDSRKIYKTCKEG